MKSWPIMRGTEHCGKASFPSWSSKKNKPNKTWLMPSRNSRWRWCTFREHETTRRMIKNPVWMNSSWAWRENINPKLMRLTKHTREWCRIMRIRIVAFRRKSNFKKISKFSISMENWDPSPRMIRNSPNWSRMRRSSSRKYWAYRLTGIPRWWNTLAISTRSVRCWRASTRSWRRGTRRWRRSDVPKYLSSRRYFDHIISQ